LVPGDEAKPRGPPLRSGGTDTNVQWRHGCVGLTIKLLTLMATGGRDERDHEDDTGVDESADTS
jgi:hypothetical protein